MLLLAGTASSQVALWEAPAPRSVLAAKQAAIPNRRSEVTSGTSVKSFSAIPKGTAVTMPLVSGKSASGTVTFKFSDENGDETIAGALPDAVESNFSIRKQGSKVTGLIRVHSTRKAYKVEGWTFGQLEITEVPLSEVECVGYPLPPSTAAAAPAAATASATTVAAAAKAQPVYSSKPAAPYVIFIDFDGVTITDPNWNSGKPIVAEPAAMTDAQIAQAWAGVAEDYAFLNVNVTTSPGTFNKTDPSRRVRCVVTPTNYFYTGAGGVALVGSFGSVNNDRSDISPVCWSFNNTDPKDVADTVAHEVGHTLDLSHDGLTTVEGDNYYGGHNGWAPIMGVGYGVPLTQWSKGEYQNANNTEDDLQKMADKVGIGYVTDDFRNSIDSADNIYAPTGKIEQSGVISRPKEADYFRIPVHEGRITITGEPVTFSPDLKIELTLYDEKGKQVAYSDTSTAALSASVQRNVTAGYYYLRVRGIGYLDPLIDGYSSYASLGAYTLTGKIPGTSVPIGDLQPDIIAGRGATRVGEGIFKERQNYRLLFDRRKVMKVPVVIVNAGFVNQIFKLKKVGHFSGHKYTVRYKGQDVTGLFKKGKLKTRELAPKQSQKLIFAFTIKHSLRKTKKLILDAVSTSDGSRKDRLEITVEPKA